MWHFSDGMTYTIQEVKTMNVFDFYEGLKFLDNKIKMNNKNLKGNVTN